jgi:hypothetical protein
MDKMPFTFSGTLKKFVVVMPPVPDARRLGSGQADAFGVRRAITRMLAEYPVQRIDQVGRGRLLCNGG